MKISVGRESRIVLLAAALGALAAPVDAMLYSSSEGYSYTSGANAYHGNELWMSSTLRFDGGWYPFTRFAYTTDSGYRWIAAPALGLEKGVAGVGRLRAGYTLYRGATRQDGLLGTTHAVELGWFRAMTPALSADASYHVLTGDLFSQAYVFQTADGTQGTRLGHSVYHEASVTGGYSLSMGGLRPRLSAGFALESSPELQPTRSESLGLSLPLGGGFWAQTTAAFHQGASGPFFATMGVSYGLSGRR